MLFARPQNQFRTRQGRPYHATRTSMNMHDRVGLVGFHDRAFVIAKPADPYSPWLQERTADLHSKIAGSSTNITDGLRVALQFASKAPKGFYRRIWLLSDGYPNREEGGIDRVVAEAKAAWCNINTIGFGDNFDENLLRRIASGTHNGKFVSVQSLRQLTDALLLTETGHRNRHHQRSELTLFAIDLSPSMTDRMENKTRIAVVEEALLHLLKYKQICFA